MESTKTLVPLMSLLLVSAYLSAHAAEGSSEPLTSNEVSFAADPIDVEWSAQKKKEIEETLSGVSSSAIECKSSMCRVALTWSNSNGGESWEEFTKRVAQWTQDVSRKGGFVHSDTDMRPNDPTTVSYLSTKLLMGRLPPGLSPEASDAFQKCLRESGERFRRQGIADPATTCTL